MSAPVPFVFESLEELLMSEMGFGLTTAEPLQRAICWVLQGQPIPQELWESPGVAEAFGNIPPSRTVAELLLLCAVRSAKTLICVAATVWMAFHVDLTPKAGIHIRAGERPQVSFVSLHKRNAEEAYNYLVGAFKTSPWLSGFLAGEPTADGLVLQRPDGNQISVRVAALSAFGANLISKWCAGIIFDEAPRMASGEDGYVFNLGDQLSAVRARVLVGAWIMIVGSPVGGVGHVYDLFQKNWQNPLQTTIVVKAPGYRMNPRWWTPERCAALQQSHPDEYESDVLANFRDVQSGLIGIESLDRCTRKDALVILPEPGKKYVAIMDPATRGNAWALLIAETPDDRFFTVCLARQWIGSKADPLDPKATLEEIRDACAPYGVTNVKSDQFAIDFVRAIALDVGLGISLAEFTSANHTKLYLSIASKMDAGMLSLPPLPEMRRDLLNLKKVYKGIGKAEPKVVLPETPDGRHCDYAPLLAILCGDHAETSAAPLKPARQKTWAEMTEDEREDFEDRAARFDWAFDDPVELGDGF